MIDISNFLRNCIFSAIIRQQSVLAEFTPSSHYFAKTSSFCYRLLDVLYGSDAIYETEGVLIVTK